MQKSLENKNQMLTRLSKSMEHKVFDRTREVMALNQKLEDACEGIVQVLTTIAGAHSLSLGNHSQRVAHLCEAVSKQLGLTHDEHLQLQVAAKLHDMGTIGLPATVLAKPVDTLSSFELKLLESHPERGAELLGQVPFFSEAAAIIRHHHEAFNGSGYPHGLIEGQIPIGARILAVVDAFDDLTYAENVGDAYSTGEALRKMDSESKKLYDPNVLNVLRDVLQVSDPLSAMTQVAEISPNQLSEGMVLARDLITHGGVLVLKKDSAITAHNFEKIMGILKKQQALGGIHVYQRPLCSSSVVSTEKQA